MTGTSPQSVCRDVPAVSGTRKNSRFLRPLALCANRVQQKIRSSNKQMLVIKATHRE
jgi:hypothetical protein